MLASARRLIVSPRPFSRLLFASILIFVLILSLVVTTGPEAFASSSLLDRARLGTWRLPAQAGPPHTAHGYQESDFIYANGKYYLFSTASQDPAWVDVYVGDTPEELAQKPPRFKHVAPIRYPTVVKDGNTWHMWGVNPPHRWTEHWTSTNADPTGFVYSDSPYLPADRQNVGLPMVDFAVRKHPTNGYWYGIGFEPGHNAPLTLSRASNPNGPWERINYKRNCNTCGLFSDTGQPPWATAARPDPNLAFTPDGRAWIFFTGNAPTTPLRPTITYRAGIVEVDLDTGKANGAPVVLFDPRTHQDLPIKVASDLNLVSAPGRPDRIFAETDSPAYPLAVLEMSDRVTPTDGRTSADLVRVDMARGFGVASGITPAIQQTPPRWTPDGLVVDANYGGATGFLASQYASDLDFNVDFTPTAINTGSINVVAYIGGVDYNAGPGVTVRIDAAEDNVPYITAEFAGSDGMSLTLNSEVVAEPRRNYAVVVRRIGSTVTLAVNGEVKATATYEGALRGLQTWSLAAEATRSQQARYPFQGVIHSFVVVTGGG